MINRIRMLRKEMGLTQVELSKLMNISGRSIGFYETGERDPDTSTLDKLASFFDVSIDYLLGRSNIRNPKKAIMEAKAHYKFDIDGLPKEAINQIEEYIQFLRTKYNPSDNL